MIAPREHDGDSGMGIGRTFEMPAASAAFFGHGDNNFCGFIDALAVGDLRTALDLGEKSGLSAKQASILVRDSGALASAMLAIGAEMSW